VPFVITLGIAGLYPMLVFLSKIKLDEKKIADLLDSVDAERKDTISEHKLISCFFSLCEILYKIKKNPDELELEEQQKQIISELLLNCQKYSIPYNKIFNRPYANFYDYELGILDSNIRDFLLSEHFAGINKTIICKMREHITDLKKKSLLNPGCKKIDSQFESGLSGSSEIKNKVLDIIAEICVKKIDVREDPLPQPIYLTRDLDLLGVREALFEYWGDLPQDELIIHYTIDFNYLSSKILIEYSERYPKEFYRQADCPVRQPVLRLAPALEYIPRPVLPRETHGSEHILRAGVP
jgi:hypothetical protein